MRKININIECDISDVYAISCVRDVISNGRRSGNADTYCYATIFFPAAMSPKGVTVLAERTRAGDDTFTIMKVAE